MAAAESGLDRDLAGLEEIAEKKKPAAQNAESKKRSTRVAQHLRGIGFDLKGELFDMLADSFV